MEFVDLGAGFRVTGIPALLIMLVILLIFIAGLVTIIRSVGRRAKGK